MRLTGGILACAACELLGPNNSRNLSAVTGICLQTLTDVRYRGHLPGIAYGRGFGSGLVRGGSTWVRPRSHAFL